MRKKHKSVRKKRNTKKITLKKSAILKRVVEEMKKD